MAVGARQSLVMFCSDGTTLSCTVLVLAMAKQSLDLVSVNNTHLINIDLENSK